jgi:predicted amidohydrolase YtcJ
VKELAIECARSNIRIIANNAVSAGMLDILESVHKKISLKGRRWVLGHVRSLSHAEIERVAAMGLIITPHTNSAIYKFGSGMEKTFGPTDGMN